MNREEFNAYLDNLEQTIKAIEGDEDYMRDRLKEIAEGVIEDMDTLI